MQPTSRHQSHREWETSVALAALLIYSTMLYGSGQPSRPRLSAEVQPILDTHCVVCHMEGGASGELVLEDGDAFNQLVGRRSIQAPLNLVEPYKPNESYLIFKLENNQGLAGGSGTAMPPNNVMLGAADLAAIIAWIEAGALE